MVTEMVTAWSAARTPEVGNNYIWISNTTAPAVPRSRTERIIKVEVVRLLLPHSRTLKLNK